MYLLNRIVTRISYSSLREMIIRYETVAIAIKNMKLTSK